MNNRVFLGLVHYPVYNKNMEIITTSITNLDLHDIARCAFTYNLARYYIIHPLPAQRILAQEIADYWQKGCGAKYNPDRKEALSLVELTGSIEEAKQAIAAKYGGQVYTVATDARTYPCSIGYRELRDILAGEEGDNYLLLFGTGWGMAEETIKQADYILRPILGRGAYNHLSVRSAAAIILDRVLGENWWQ